MLKKLVALAILALCGIAGFWSGAQKPQKKGIKICDMASKRPNKFYSFVAVVYGKEDTAWCERALRSVFEQNYDSYRVIFIDDASVDDTFEKANRFVEENRQEGRTILIQNSIPIGYTASLKRAAEQCFDKEIIIPIHARDWLAHPDVISSLNIAFDFTKTDALFMGSVQYPGYTITHAENGAAFAPYFRNLTEDQTYLKALKKAKSLERVQDLLVFSNQTLSRERGER